MGNHCNCRKLKKIKLCCLSLTDKNRPSPLNSSLLLGLYMVYPAVRVVRKKKSRLAPPPNFLYMIIVHKVHLFAQFQLGLP